MNEQLVVTFNWAHVRVYRQRDIPLRDRPNLVLLEVADVPVEPAPRDNPVARTDPASGAGQDAGAPRSDNRLWPDRDHRQRVIALIAQRVQRVLLEYPTAQWQCAASADLWRDVFSRLESDAQRRLKCEIDKDLAHLSPKELEDHFLPRSV